MRHVLIPVSLCEKDMKNMCGRYHFGDTGLRPLIKAYAEFLPDRKASVYYEWLEEKRAAVLITLGKEPDLIQERLMEKGRLSEAYMVECLAAELLAVAYQQADCLLHEESGLWCFTCEFPGVQQPIEALEALFRTVPQEEICYNEAYALSPLKSVAYVALLSDEKPAGSRMDKMCAGCGRKECAGRRVKYGDSSLNYGYRRIFGGDR